MDGLRFQVLGPLDVLRAGRSVALQGARRRGVLALLVLADGAVVPREQLIDGIWGERVPGSAENLVQGYVSLWRRALEPERGGGRGSAVLLTGPAGYRLDLSEHDVDLRELVDIVEGRTPDAGARDRLQRAAVLASAAPLSDLRDLPFHQGVATRLADLQLQAVESCADRCLREGLSDGVVEALRLARERAPLRERVTELLMWALYEQGRQAEALAEYERLGRLLDDELGARPGSSLRAMHLRVLQHDPALHVTSKELPRPRADAGSGMLTRPTPGWSAPRPPVSPPPPDGFYGRDDDLAALSGLLGQRRLVTLTGPGGAGKTRLALELLARSTAGGAFVDCSALSASVTQEGLAETVLQAFGASRDAAATATGQLVALLAVDVEALVLDNLEHLGSAPNLVAALVERTPSTRIVVTSRVPLGVRGEQVFPVRALAPVGPAGGGAAMAMLADRVHAVDPRCDVPHDEAALELCRRLDGLPLAIELASGWVPLLGVEGLLEQLREGTALLEDSGSGRPARHGSLRSTIGWSYELLAPPSQRLLRVASTFRAGFDLGALEAVHGSTDRPAVLRCLRDLAAKNLVEVDGSVSGRFRLLETVREFAADHLVEEGESELVRGRHAEHYARLALASGPELTGPSRAEHLDRLTIDRDNLSAALEHLLLADPGLGLRAAGAVWRFWHLRGHLAEGRRLVERLLASAEGTGSADGRKAGLADLAAGWQALGGVRYWQLDSAAAVQAYERAREYASVAGDAAVLAHARYDLGYACAVAGLLERSREQFAAAATYYQERGDALGLAHVQAGTALLQILEGDTEGAAASIRASSGIFRAQQDQHSVDNNLNLLGTAMRLAGRLTEAELALHEAGRGHVVTGNSSGLVWVLHELSATAVLKGDLRRAFLLHELASTTAARTGGRVPMHLVRLPDVPAAAAALSGVERAAIARRAHDLPPADVAAEVTGEAPAGPT